MYTDVRSDAWYADDVKEALLLGLLTGYPDGTFRPEQPPTRAELAAALVRQARNELAIERWVGQQLRAQTAPAVVYLRTDTGSVGSGVIVTADGYVITADHVVADAKTVEVTFPDWPGGPDMVGPLMDVIQRYPEVDLALCRIRWDTMYPFVRAAETPAIPSEPVIMLGAPAGVSSWESAGRVARPEMYLRYYTTPQMLVPVAGAINPGNSGGALIRAADGTLLGINTMKLVDVAIEGMAFAVPATVVREKVAGVITI